MLGKIVASNRGVYVVYVNGITYNVFPRGIFKFKNEHLVVGDNVEFDEENFTITSIQDRTNELIRPKCSNVDQIFIAMSVVEPDLSLELLYKFLTYVNMNGIKAKVILTKIDLLKDLTVINRVKEDLEKLGTEVFLLSPNSKDVIEKIKESFSNKTSIIMGQTGVGKSTFINHIDPTFNRRVGEYSEARGRGKHQTKEVILLSYNNGFIGDTPGFSSLDLGVYKEDLAQFFPGYNEFYTQCHFTDCLHQKEKDCKIKEEIENNHLSSDAYKVYLKLLEELPYRKERYK